jgi:hypothetical protein
LSFLPSAILILPISVARWIQFTAPNVRLPSEAIAFCSIIFNTSGFVNVILYITTRPSLLPSFRCLRRRRGSRVGGNVAGTSTETSFPEATILSVVETQAHLEQHGAQEEILQSPMLKDDDSIRSHGRSPSPNGTKQSSKMLVVPQSGDRSSWSSDHKASGRSSFGHPSPV